MFVATQPPGGRWHVGSWCCWIVHAGTHLCPSCLMWCSRCVHFHAVCSKVHTLRPLLSAVLPSSQVCSTTQEGTPVVPQGDAAAAG
jgi:hypothetical protein